MRTCAYAHGYPPHILFFHFHTFFRREIPAVLSVFLLFGGSLRVVSAEGVLCVMQCFFWGGVCVLFFDSGFVWEFVWRFGFVLRVLSDVGENDGCQFESM